MGENLNLILGYWVKLRKIWHVFSPLWILTFIKIHKVFYIWDENSYKDWWRKGTSMNWAKGIATRWQTWWIYMVYLKQVSLRSLSMWTMKICWWIFTHWLQKLICNNYYCYILINLYPFKFYVVLKKKTKNGSHSLVCYLNTKNVMSIK